MLVYRTICDLPNDDAPRVAAQLFEEWVGEKHPNLAFPSEGHAKDEGTSILVANADTDDLRAYRGRLEEENEDGMWTTTVNAAHCGTGRWIWVDVERVADDPFGRAPVPRPPRLVRRFLERHACYCGEISAQPSVGEVNGDIDLLSDELFHEQRELPVVVVSTRWGEANDDKVLPIDRRARELASGLAGIAHVRRLDATATSRLREAYGELAVWSGAIRVYRPAMSEGDPSFKHPIFPYHRVRAPQQALRAVQGQVGRFAASRRPPSLYLERVRFLPGFPSGPREGGDQDFEALLGIAESERDQAVRQLEETGAATENLRDEIELGRLEYTELESELRDASARVTYLERRLAEAGEPQYGTETPEGEKVAEAEGCEEAVEMAAEQLELVELCDGARSAAAELDGDGKAGIWGAKAWRSFRALQRFAEWNRGGEGVGDFAYFSTHRDDHPECVPETWIAMQENEGVDLNPGYRGARTFKVPTEVNSEGCVYMPAHIKIQAGKPPAPRVHFYDDTRGATGKIWIGYFGEHLPSPETN